jgi:hypothetical protein
MCAKIGTLSVIKNYKSLNVRKNRYIEGMRVIKIGKKKKFQREQNLKKIIFCKKIIFFKFCSLSPLWGATHPLNLICERTP